MSFSRSFLRPLLVPAAITALLGIPSSARAQYLYLDANGDGLHTAADVLSATGVTSVDVWLRTDARRDGAPAACPTGPEPLGIFSYILVLRATNGAVTWGTFTNRMASLASPLGEISDATDFATGFGGTAALPPGLYRLGTIEVAAASGTPSLDAAPWTPLTPDFVTAFGSPCPGLDLSHTIQLGVDWTDTDGLRYGGTANAPPSLLAVADMTVPEGETAAQAVTATDPDGDPLTFEKAAGPAYMSVSTVDPGTGTGMGEILLAPGFSDEGAATGTVRAADALIGVERTFEITVVDRLRPPNLLPVGDQTMDEREVRILPLAVVHPDGDRVVFEKTEGPHYMTIQTVSSLAGNVFLRPGGQQDVGTVQAAVRAVDGDLEDVENFTITVRDVRYPPFVLFTGASGKFHVGGEEVIEIAVLDPDGDEISSVTFDRSELPPEDHTVFTMAPDNRTGQLRWVPTQPGWHYIPFTATDSHGLSGTTPAWGYVHPRIPTVRFDGPRDIGLGSTVTIRLHLEGPDANFVEGIEPDLSGLPADHDASFEFVPGSTVASLTWTPRLSHLGAEPEARTFPLGFTIAVGDSKLTDTTSVTLWRQSQAYLTSGRLGLITGNTGESAWDRYLFSAYGAGLHYPRAIRNGLMRGLALHLGTKEDDGALVSRGGAEFGPGTMDEGAPTPWTPRFRSYRIERGGQDSADWRDWPAVDGAPVDATGQPALEGDRMTWSVCTDARAERQTPAGGAGGTFGPLGIEVRQSAFGFDAPGPLETIQFVRLRLRNRSGVARDGLHASLHSHPTIGSVGPPNDRVGCDPALQLGYCYNGPPADSGYGARPPAVGIVLLRGPEAETSPGVRVPLGMTAFSSYDQFDTQTALPLYFYNRMRGLNPDGTIMVDQGDPSRPPTTFRYSGDPVAGTGWTDTVDGDKRMMISTGPFRLGPDEEQEVVVAILVGQGATHLESVAELRRLAPIARAFYESGFTAFPDGVPTGEWEWVSPNRPPVADPGGPYAGAAGAPVEFRGDRSADPDGDALTYRWFFGDGAEGAGAVARHAYASGGNYTARLTVADAAASATAEVAVGIAGGGAAGEAAARAVPLPGQETIRLGSGRSSWSLAVEPVGKGFQCEDVVPGSLRLVSHGTGSAESIDAAPGKRTSIGDRDRNGAPDLEVSFARADLERLFDALPSGRHEVPVTVEGALAGGAHLHAPAVLTVIAGEVLVASVSPSPVSGAGTLAFRTTRPGRVAVKLFDVTGRLVRRLLHEERPAGYHALGFEARRGDGARLPSGVYFYTIESAEGVARGRLTVVR